MAHTKLPLDITWEDVRKCKHKKYKQLFMIMSSLMILVLVSFFYLSFYYQSEPIIQENKQEHKPQASSSITSHTGNGITQTSSCVLVHQWNSKTALLVGRTTLSWCEKNMHVKTMLKKTHQ